MPTLILQAESERVPSKTDSSSVAGDDGRTPSESVHEHSENASEVKDLASIEDTIASDAEVSRICSSEPSACDEQEDLQESKSHLRSQSLVDIPQKGRLKQLLSPIPLPRILGGCGPVKSKVGSCPVPSENNSPINSDDPSLELVRPAVPTVARKRTCEFDLAKQRSAEFDPEPAEAWSMVPQPSFAPVECPYYPSHGSGTTNKSGRGIVNRARRRLLELFEEPFGSRGAWVLSTALILNNSTSFILLCMEGPVTESLDREVHDGHGHVQLVVNVICTIEALLRFWCSPRRRRSLGHAPNAIDLACVLPFWLIKVAQLHAQLNWPVLYLATRLEFGFRLLKLCRYFSGWQLLFLAGSDAAPALLLPLVALGLIVGLGSCMVLIAEEATTLAGGENATLRGFPDALMFCLLCIVAIDAGPFYELELVSKGGQLIVSVLMMCGLVVFAMPISIVGTCFCRVWFQRHRLLFLEALRRRVEREHRTDTTTTLKELFDSFDRSRVGELGLQEFKWFARSIVPWLTASTVLSIFSSFDQDQDGTVSFQEVQAAVFPEEADLEFLINNVAEKETEEEHAQEEEQSMMESADVTVYAPYDSRQTSVLYESHATEGSGKGSGEEPPDGRREEVLQVGPRNSHISIATSQHSAVAQAAAATAQTVRLLGVLDTRLRSLEKRQCEVPITPWYALGPPASPAKSLLSTRRSSLKSAPRSSSAEPGRAQNSLTVNRGQWSSQNSIRSSKISNITDAYTDQRREGRGIDDATSVHGTLLGTSQLPSACSSRCPSVMSPGSRGETAASRRISTILPQIPDNMTESGSRSRSKSSSRNASREHCWASSRRNTTAGVLGGASAAALKFEEMMAVQDEQEDEHSPKSEASEAWEGAKKIEIPVMQITRTESQSLEIVEDGPDSMRAPNRGPPPAAVLLPPQTASTRSSVSRSPSRRVSRVGTAGAAGGPNRRMSTEPGSSAVASLVRRVSAQQENESAGDELSFATGEASRGVGVGPRRERRASSTRPAVREVGSAAPALASNSPLSGKPAASAALDNSHLR